MHTTVSTFLGDMDLALKCVQFAEDVSRLAGQPEPASTEAFGVTAHRTLSFVASERSWELISLDGILLYTVVRFEAAVEGLVEKAAAWLPLRVPVYAQLPDSVHTRHTRGLAHILTHPTWYDGADVRTALTTVAECLDPASSAYSIVTQAFTGEHRNLGPDVLVEVLNRLGLRHLWRDVGDDGAVQSHFGTLGDQRVTTEKARNTLDEIIKRRNEIAHPLRRGVFAGPGVVRGYIDYLKVLVPVIHTRLASHLAGL